MNCENDFYRCRRLEDQGTCVYRRVCPVSCPSTLSLPGAAVCDIPPCADLKEVTCTVNHLLESLRCAGVIEPRCDQE